MSASLLHHSDKKEGRGANVAFDTKENLVNLVNLENLVNLVNKLPKFPKFPKFPNLPSTTPLLLLH